LDNFKLLGTFDPQLILKEAETNPLWNWLTLRSYAGHTDDIILRYQSVETSRKISDFFDSLICVDYFSQALCPAALTLINTAIQRPIGRIVLARMNPGNKIPQHTDEGAYSDATDRIHFVLSTNPAVEFYSGGEQQHMAAGEIWWFNNHMPHRVENMGTTPRIHLIVDTFK
jgi:hypothetical protein